MRLGLFLSFCVVSLSGFSDCSRTRAAQPTRTTIPCSAPLPPRPAPLPRNPNPQQNQIIDAIRTRTAQFLGNINWNERTAQLRLVIQRKERVFSWSFEIRASEGAALVATEQKEQDDASFQAFLSGKPETQLDMIGHELQLTAFSYRPDGGPLQIGFEPLQITIKPLEEVKTDGVEKRPSLRMEIEIISRRTAEKRIFETTVVLQNSRETSFDIGTFNLLGANDDVENNSKYDLPASGSNFYRDGMAYRKLDNNMQAIMLAGLPDVAVFQELEATRDGRAQELLTQWTKALGYNYINFCAYESGDGGTANAIASKYPLTALPPIDDLPRRIQISEAKIGETSVRIFNNHWKAKTNGAAGSANRLHSARALRNAIDQLMIDEPTLDAIALGDFNAAWFDPELRENGLKSTSHESDMWSGNSDKRRNLYNLWFELPWKQRWEFSYSGNYENLANILLTSALFDNEGIQYVERSYRVPGQNGVGLQGKLLGADGEPFTWQKLQTQTGQNGSVEYPGHGYSDHLPLVARFRFADKTPFETSKAADESPQAPSESNPVVVKVCDPTKETIADASNLELFDPKNEGLCVTLSGDFPVEPIGIYEIGVRPKGKRAILIGMTRAWDPRPNLDDSDVAPQTLSTLAILKQPDPRSNLCYLQNVLRKSKPDAATGYSGGRLLRATGRLGWKNGALGILVAKRADITLENPPASASACEP